MNVFVTFLIHAPLLLMVALCAIAFLDKWTIQ